MRHLLPLALALLAACSDSTDEENFTCALGELSGTWRLTYEELDGTCGPLPAETVSLGATGGGSSSCQEFYSKISSDKCKLEIDFACPTTDGQGSTRWTGVTNHTAAERLEGTATAQLTHPTGNCRSTYKTVYSKL